MSWQAMEAVQDSDEIKDHTALAIMYAIARFADAAGVAGANGRTSAPAIDTIAARARCHRNTVLNWLPKLEKDGVLRVERFGTGRGSWNRYTLLVPIGGDNGTNNGTTQDVPKLEVMVQDLTQKIDLLVQVMVHNGTTLDVPDTDNTDKEKNIYIPPEAQTLITELSKVSKTPYWPKTEDEYLDAAYCLAGFDADPPQIAAFGEWWETNGFYPGKPALKSILDNWANFTAGITTSGAPDEKPPASDPYQTALAHAARGDPNFTDETLKTAVRLFGWPRLQAIKPGDENFYRAEFMRIFNEQQQRIQQRA